MQEILNGFLLSILAGGALFIAVSIQQLDAVNLVWRYILVSHHFAKYAFDQQGMNQPDLYFIADIFTVLVCMCVLFPFCYISTYAFESLKSINKCIYNINWYELPLKNQPYIKLLLLSSQGIRELSAYGTFNCSLETFKKVHLIFQIIYGEDIEEILSNFRCWTLQRRFIWWSSHTRK